MWKTTDYGKNWVNITDGFLETGSIGAVQVAVSDPNIIYVGTGSDGIRSNVITGRALYKSTDAGKTWEFIGLRNTGQCGAVEVHPDNPDIVFVAAIGQAFGKNPERGVYKSIDGGKNWKKLTNGLPSGLFGKSDLAVSPADPKRVYVLIEAPVGDGGLYRSDDYGENFTLVSTQANLLDRPFYYLNVDADPTNADVLYVNSTGFYKSTDGGKSWSRRSTPHGDNHDIWINPNNPDIFIQSNDGGANVTIDGGRTWSTQHNQPTAELYQVNLDDQFPYWVYAGQQDNSTIAVPSLPPYSHPAGAAGFWISIGGCETGPAVPKPGNPDIVYANCKGRFGRYNKKTGQEKQYYVGAANMYGHNPKDLKYRFQRVSPIHVSPHNPDVVYHASQYLHKTMDEGVTWETISPDLTAFEPDKQVYSGTPITRDITGEEFYSTIYAVQESPLEKGLIWVGANDGPVHVTRNGGQTWTNVTPINLPKGGRVQTIEPSPHRPEKAYFATYRYLLGDWKPYIYKTENYGKTWKRLTTGNNGIPEDYPARVIREDPDREGLLYAGTEFGMFISFDDGEHWQPFQLNLPVTPVTDIKVYRNDLVLSTMGRSFWILDDVTHLHQLSREIEKANYHLFTPKDAYRMQYSSRGRSSANPEYIQAGVHFDYYLAEDIDGEIKFEIYDFKNNLVRSITGRKQQRRRQMTEEQSRMMRFFRSSSRNPSVEAGMHRFIWDMRLDGVAGSNQRGFSRSGPLAVPGTYTVKMIVGDWSQTKQFELLIDPRVREDGVTQADLEEQLALCLKVQELQSEAGKTNEKIRDALKETKVQKKKALEALQSKFVTASGRYQTPMLLNQISYLSSMLNRADQKPGKDAYIRYEELKILLKEYTEEYTCITDKKMISIINYQY